MNFTTINHYVPQWYQQHFLNENDKFYYLDLCPEKVSNNGHTYRRTAMMHWGPRICFMRENLYTMRFFNLASDVIEKRFFGPIDCCGPKIWKGFLGNHLCREYIDACRDIIHVMDVQWCRTPKGLALIKQQMDSVGIVMDDNKILALMMKIHRDNVTVWSECVWEVVSANHSNTKFLLTDNPVTFYHPLCIPHLSTVCIPPNEINPWKIGTQVIFPLTSEKCLILTHVESVGSSLSLNLFKLRTNARVYGETLKFVGDIINGRQLCEDDVIKVNFALKQRALRYVAATNREWLFPERSFKCMWQDIRQILMPTLPYDYGSSEIFLHYKDGSSIGVDAFGRPLANPQQKIVEMKKQVEQLIKNKMNNEV